MCQCSTCFSGENESITFDYPGVTIGFTERVSSVGKNSSIQIAVKVLSGTLREDIDLEVFTDNGTAKGKTP